jgi:hypothetical protein
MTIWSSINYHPSLEQSQAHEHKARFKLVAGGERAGKSYSAAMELVNRCDVPEGLYWIVGPTYELCRPEFSYVNDALKKAGVVLESSFPAQGACSLVTLWHAKVETRTAEDVRKLAGLAPDGILMSEAAQQSWDAYSRLRGRLSEKRGWLWMSGTFEGSMSWYADLWRRWQGENAEHGRSFSIPTWSNRAVFPGGRVDPEIIALERTYPADMFQERCGAVPCPPATLVFREFSYQDHVSHDAAYDPELPVELAVDPGYAGAYAVLALQEQDGLIFMIDEVYLTATVAEDVIAECERREWWEAVTGGVIDVAGRQHAGLPSHVEIWREKAGLYLSSNRVKVVDGINRLRTFLREPGSGVPRLLINPRCTGLLAEFGKYRYQAVVENRPVREEPIDRDNHSLKALGYWLYARFGPVEREEVPAQLGVDRLAEVVQQVHYLAGGKIDLAMQDDGRLVFVPRETVNQRRQLAGVPYG